MIDRGSCIRMLLVPAARQGWGWPWRGGVGPGLGRVGPPVDLAPFYLGKFEVTREEWDRAMNAAAGPPVPGTRLPQTNVAFGEVRLFLQRTGLRLPTDEEWVHACRLREPGRPRPPLGEVAWHAENSLGLARPVGRKQPTGPGFHDLVGNAMEICVDPSRPHVLPIVGGSARHDPSLLREWTPSNPWPFHRIYVTDTRDSSSAGSVTGAYSRSSASTDGPSA